MHAHRKDTDHTLAHARSRGRRHGKQLHELGVELAAPRHTAGTLQAPRQPVMVDMKLVRNPVQAMLLGHDHRRRPQVRRNMLAA